MSRKRRHTGRIPPDGVLIVRLLHEQFDLYTIPQRYSSSNWTSLKLISSPGVHRRKPNFRLSWSPQENRFARGHDHLRLQELHADLYLRLRQLCLLLINDQPRRSTPL